MKYERERKKQLKLRQERMIKIITKITQEMNNDIRLRKKSRDIRLKRLKLEDVREKRLAEISSEKIRSEESQIVEESVPEINKKNRKIEDSTVKDLTLEESGKAVENKKENDIARGKRESERFVTKGSKSSVEQVFERDTCFFAIPCIVAFEVSILIFSKILTLPVCSLCQLL